MGDTTVTVKIGTIRAVNEKFVELEHYKSLYVESECYADELRKVGDEYEDALRECATEVNKCFASNQELIKKNKKMERRLNRWQVASGVMGGILTGVIIFLAL